VIRTVYDKLLDWKVSPRRKPLILEGVRQCGKTHILKKFGNENYSSTVYLNFEETPALASLFERDLDPKRIISELKMIFSKDINEDTLLIFDEIQCCGKALTSLKYFQEKVPQYSVVCAGSLLGLLHSTSTSFPVGKVEFLKMYPLSFSEFMIASGRRDIHEYLSTISDINAIPESTMNILDDLYREYCFVGGMPEAVLSWLEFRDPEKTRKVQSDLIRLYQSDFAKYAPKNDVKKLQSIWSSVPEQLSKENKKFIFGHAVKGGRARDLEDSLQWLIDAGIVVRVKLVSVPMVPLSAYGKSSYFKIYSSDIGLLGAMADMKYSSLISDDTRYKEFKGAVTENYVLNELINTVGSTPYYWRSEGKAEIDFIQMINDTIVPIEVKSGAYGRLRSMELYMDLYKPEKAAVISKERTRSDSIISIPLALVWKIQDLI
jgi:Predicted ATPase (AAA+ superfamily)